MAGVYRLAVVLLKPFPAGRSFCPARTIRRTGPYPPPGSAQRQDRHARCGQQQWRGAYSLPHRVLDSSAADADVLELEVLLAPTPDRILRE